MKDHFTYQAYVKTLEILHSITKLDIRLNDAAGSTIHFAANHAIPAVLNQSGYIAHIHKILQRNETDQYVHYIDSYGLEYMAAGIWTNQTFRGSLLLGPIISSLEIVDRMADIIASNHLPIAERYSLEQFYQSLPVLSDVEIKHTGELLTHLCIHPPVHYQQTESVPPKGIPAPHSQNVVLEEHKRVIEQRYEQQNNLMDAIRSGDSAKVSHPIELLVSALVEFTDRVPGSPIRSSKNIGFVLNTMCRIAAEQGGVHPVYLHNLSERFAISIEKTASIPKLRQLFEALAKEYCDLVAAVSTAPYSPAVKKAIDYIGLHLGSPITLNVVANDIPINASHLSRKFKAETGMTFSEFVNRKRIEEAKLYLQRGHLPVTDIALMVGFNDLNYFSKVFKKLTDQTPTEFANHMVQNGHIPSPQIQ